MGLHPGERLESASHTNFSTITSTLLLEGTKTVSPLSQCSHLLLTFGLSIANVVSANRSARYWSVIPAGSGMQLIM
jgi:hypothetical protein